MGAFVDITGHRFGKLIAIRSIGNGLFGKWVFRCDCGKEKAILKQNVCQGKVRSCGCLNKKRGMDRRLRLIGQKFGRLTVVGLGRCNGATFWDCLCDCGKRIRVQGSYLVSGHTKSCGCNRVYRLEKGSVGLSILYKQRYRFRALKSGKEFNLSMEEFKELTKRRCHYCGIEPALVIKSKSSHSEYVYNGLDRLDSSRGYTPDNVVPCCAVCNRMKSDYSSVEFARHIRRISNYWLSKMVGKGDYYTRLKKMEAEAGIKE